NSYETTYIVSEGSSLAEAIASMSRIAGRQLYWGHAGVFILSRDVLEHSIRPVLDWFMRDATARLSSMVVAAGTEQASSVYALKSPVQKSISLSLEQILENFQTAKSRTAVSVNELINLYGVRGSAICMPMVNAERNADEEILAIDSYAVLKQDVLSGIYTGADVVYLMLLLENPIQNAIAVEIPEQDTVVRIQALDHSIDLAVSERDGHLHAQIDLMVNVSIVGSEGDDASIRDRLGNEILTTAAESLIAEGCTAVLERDLHEFCADILSIGRHVSRHNPELWGRVGEDWDEHYAQMSYEVCADVRIDKSGETSPVNDQEVRS
ncbi:MAG: hypothetical protein IKU55_04100, partial [Clostridia bacterium]|nr:hypothetical protein [Clostridia bacterium]